MGFIKKRIKKRISKNRLANIWKLTDEVIQIKDIVKDITPEFSSRFNINEKYTCMRDLELNNSSIYIKESDIEKFKDIKLIYDREYNYINLSLLKKYVIMKDAYVIVANKTVPPAVNIKLVYYCNIMDINLYIEKSFMLLQDATMFKDLLNFQSLKDKHNLK